MNFTGHFEKSAQGSKEPKSKDEKAVAKRNPWGNKSYADLITQAIENSPERRLTLSQIYEWMISNVPHFGDKGDHNSSAGWKNSVRHNLSLHNRFIKIQNEGSGKSSWWSINPKACGRDSKRRTTAEIRNRCLKNARVSGRALETRQAPENEATTSQSRYALQPIPPVSSFFPNNFSLDEQFSYGSMLEQNWPTSAANTDMERALAVNTISVSAINSPPIRNIYSQCATSSLFKMDIPYEQRMPPCVTTTTSILSQIPTQDQATNIPENSYKTNRHDSVEGKFCDCRDINMLNISIPGAPVHPTNSTHLLSNTPPVSSPECENTQIYWMEGSPSRAESFSSEDTIINVSEINSDSDFSDYEFLGCFAKDDSLSDYQFSYNPQNEATSKETFTYGTNSDLSNLICSVDFRNVEKCEFADLQDIGKQGLLHDELNFRNKLPYNTDLKLDSILQAVDNESSTFSLTNSNSNSEFGDIITSVLCSLSPPSSPGYSLPQDLEECVVTEDMNCNMDAIIQFELDEHGCLNF